MGSSSPKEDKELIAAKLGEVTEDGKNRMAFSKQIALLNQMNNQGLLTEIEYEKIKEYMKKKYKIIPYI